MGRTAIAVIGGGAWGTALAVHLARIGHDVRLWVHEPELVERILERRDNPLYLPGVPIPEGVRPYDEFAHALHEAEMVIAVVPTQFARDVYRKMQPALDRRVPVVVTSKGIEQETLALPLQVAAEELGVDHPAVVLSGPTFAREVAFGKPAAVVAAGEPRHDRFVQQVMSSPTLRVYTNSDPVGVQLAGALKNVIAIAAGVVEGLGMGSNAVAALITRGLAEMARLGLASGGRAETFSGLAGLGDLVLTCNGELSRNRTLGRKLAHGERLMDVLATSRSVAEGVRTTVSARDLAARVGVEMPIVDEVHRLLYEDGSPREAVTRLMQRPLTSESSG